MKAENVLRAASRAFQGTNNDDSYYASKPVRFLWLCGVVPETGPDQQIDKGIIDLAARAMMDADTEARFWQYLAELEGKDETD